MKPQPAAVLPTPVQPLWSGAPTATTTSGFPPSSGLAPAPDGRVITVGCPSVAIGRVLPQDVLTPPSHLARSA